MLRSGGVGTANIGLQVQGAWDASVTYTANQIVTYGGSSYYAVVSSTGTVPGTDATKWGVLAQAGSTGTQGTPGTSVGAGLLSGGGVINTSNYNYTVSQASYIINGTQYSSPQTNLTLTAADGTNDRIDVLAVNTSGAAVVVTGVAAANPAEPTLDPLTQLKVEFIYVAAGSTAATVSTTNIYLEDTEWTTTSSGATIVKNSTSNPYAGSKDIEATAAVNADYISLSNGATFDTTTRNTLAFFIRSKAAWANAKSVVIQWYNGTVAKGTPVTLKTGAYGFNSGTVGSYQLVVIPMAAFGVGGITVDRIRFTVTGSGGSIGWYLDNIIMQAGVAQTSPTAAMIWRGAYSSAVQYVLNDVVVSANIAYVSLQTQLGTAPGGATWAALSGGAGTGTVTNTGGNLTANAVVLGAGTVDSKVVAGIISDGVSKVTLGVAGASVGATAYNNATSGTITVQPVAGALGTVTLSLPATTGTLISNPMTTGGDTIYGGASGVPTRLANGSSGNVLTSAGGTSPPTWSAPATNGTVTTVSVTTANGFSGTVATATTTPAITVAKVPNVASPAYAASITQSITNIDQIDVGTLTGNLTLTLSGGADGQAVRIRFKQDGTGSRLLTLDAKFRLGTDIASVTLTTTASKTDYLGVVYHSTDDKYDVVAFVKGF